MINLYNQDCLTFMKGLPDKAYELAVVDPPYGIGVGKLAYTQADNRMVKQKNGSLLAVKGGKYEHKDWDRVPPSPDYFIELKRVSKNQIVWGWNYYGIAWGDGLIKWNKLQPDGVSFNKYEYAYCSLIDREVCFTYLWAGMSQAVSLDNPTIQRGDKRKNESRIHPTQKPINLYKWLLQNYAKKGDKILDTHGGSMSIAIACYDLGYSLDLCELDKDYFEAGQKRLDDHIAKYAPCSERPATSKGELKLF